MKNRIFQCFAMQTSPYLLCVKLLITIAPRNLQLLILFHNPTPPQTDITADNRLQPTVVDVSQPLFTTV